MTGIVGSKASVIAIATRRVNRVHDGNRTLCVSLRCNCVYNADCSSMSASHNVYKCFALVPACCLRSAARCRLQTWFADDGSIVASPLTKHKKNEQKLLIFFMVRMTGLVGSKASVIAIATRRVNRVSCTLQVANMVCRRWKHRRKSVDKT